MRTIDRGRPPQPGQPPTTRFVLYAMLGLAVACTLTIGAAIETAQRTVERDAMLHVDQSMQVAWHMLHELGPQARLVDGRLYVGNTQLDGDLDLVDAIQRVVGGVATVFRGDERVATNVLDRQGRRGIATHLAFGVARDAVLREHRPFRGVVDVLGQPYYSGYDPITDRDGQVIGILYVGLKQSDVQITTVRMEAVIIGVSFGAMLLIGMAFHLFGRRLDRQIALRERLLAETNAHLDTALSAMGNGLCLWGADNRLVLANRRLCEILDLPQDRVVAGLTFREYLGLRHAAGNFGEASFEAVHEERSAVLQLREPRVHTDLFVNGRTITTLFRPVASGGWVATYDDVTEQRAAESARAEAESDLLREREKVAEEASRAKSGFLAMMSHEIRTPMNAVLGLAGSLLDGSLPPEKHKMVQAIHDSGDILLRILNDILDFTKLDAGRMTFEDAAFSPAVLTHSTVSLLGPQAVGKGLTINADCDPAVPPALIGDAGRIRQILLNLVSNAVKFTETGTVTVRCECIAHSAGLATLRWLVADTGIGIPAASIGRLFGEFIQADDSITRRFGGSGLGLAISRRLAVQMGGTITVESTPGEGTTFRVELTLPVSAQSLATTLRPVDPAPAFRALLAARGERLRILFAEDNPINQLVARQLLKDLDVQVDVVGDGREAVDAAARFVYDVVFMDMRMPEMDGLQAARAIRRGSEPMARVPIIALTANAFAEDVKACLDAGMDQFLSKPVSKDMLLAAMLTALTAGGPGPAAPDAALQDESADRDRDGLAELRDDIGPEAVGEMLAVFETDTRARLRSMAGSLDDRDALLREAHSLRGAAAAASATSLAALTGAMEARLRAGGSVSTADLFGIENAFADYLTLANATGERARHSPAVGA